MKTTNVPLTLTIALLGIWISLSSCGNSPLAETRKSFEGGCWSMNDTLELGFHVSDTQKVYKIFFPATFTEEYRYNNIYLKLIVRAPNGLENGVPYQYQLMNEEGVWQSEHSGSKIPFRLNLGEALRFNQTGDYRFQVFHYMRESSLCGIEEAGVVIEDSK